jgi:hypothetical protein
MPWDLQLEERTKSRPSERTIADPAGDGIKRNFDVRTDLLYSHDAESWFIVEQTLEEGKCPCPSWHRIVPEDQT